MSLSSARFEARRVCHWLAYKTKEKSIEVCLIFDQNWRLESFLFTQKADFELPSVHMECYLVAPGVDSESHDPPKTPFLLIVFYSLSINVGRILDRL